MKLLECYRVDGKVIGVLLGANWSRWSRREEPVIMVAGYFFAARLAKVLDDFTRRYRGNAGVATTEKSETAVEGELVQSKGESMHSTDHRKPGRGTSRGDFVTMVVKNDCMLTELL